MTTDEYEALGKTIETNQAELDRMKRETEIAVTRLALRRKRSGDATGKSVGEPANEGARITSRLYQRVLDLIGDAAQKWKGTFACWEDGDATTDLAEERAFLFLATVAYQSIVTERTEAQRKTDEALEQLVGDLDVLRRSPDEAATAAAIEAAEAQVCTVHNAVLRETSASQRKRPSLKEMTKEGDTVGER